MEDRLSITIVAYRNYDDIQNAIRTIESFTTCSISKRIYIVDNSEWEQGECNPCLESFKNFLQCFRDIEYIYTGANLGFGKGHNLVLSKLKSKYHAIVNPDIILDSDALSSILEYMDQNTDVGMCIPKIKDERGALLPVYRNELTVLDMFIRMFCGKMFAKRQSLHTMQNMDYTKPFPVPFAQGSFLVIRTSLFQKLNGFDENFFMYVEDADLCKRVNQSSKVMYFPGASVIHKWEKGSHKKWKLFKEHLHSTVYYFKKWGLKIY